MTLIPFGPKAGWILFWRSSGGQAGDRPQETFLWEPDGAVVRKVCVQEAGNPQFGDVFCTGSSSLDDGRLVVAGGTAVGNLTTGSVEAWLFDPSVLADPPPSFPPGWPAWKKLPNMSQKRWYPGAMTLADGRFWTGGGGKTSYQVPEVQFSNSWEILNHNPALPPSLWSWDFGQGLPAPDTFRLYPHSRLLSDWDPVTNFHPGFPSADIIVLMHEGHIFGGGNPLPFGSSNNAWLLSTTDPAHTGPIDASLFWRAEGNSLPLRLRDPATNELEDRFMIVGGKKVAPFPEEPDGRQEVEYIHDPLDPLAMWVEDAPPLPPNEGRLHCNTVLLPDGSVLVIGGVERDYWLTFSILPKLTPLGLRIPDVAGSPGSGWQTLAPQAHLRAYHSVAMLLRDGRVVSMGGEFKTPATPPNHPFFNSTFTFQSDVEIYSPPYLFQGERPVILKADWPAGYGEDFSVLVDVPPGASIGSIVLMRPSSVTHGLDFQQKRVPLAFLPVGAPEPLPNGWTRVAFDATAPANGHQAAPGYYMLFVLTAPVPGGPGAIPSVAKFLRLKN